MAGMELIIVTGTEAQVVMLSPETGHINFNSSSPTLFPDGHTVIVPHGIIMVTVLSVCQMECPVSVHILEALHGRTKNIFYPCFGTFIERGVEMLAVPDTNMSDYNDSFHLQLSFSLHSESTMPIHLRNGFYNCSVDYYPQLQIHFHCNVYPECEDGRDEEGPCSYQHPHCPGQVYSPYACYKMVTNVMTESVKSNGSSQSRPRDYCRSQGGTLAMPKWLDELPNAFVPVEWYVGAVCSPPLLIGVVFGNDAFPDMYEMSLIADDKTVIHHTQHHMNTIYMGKKLSCYLWSFRSVRCEKYPPPKYYVLCEFKQNRTGHTQNRSKNMRQSIRFSLVSDDLITDRNHNFLVRCENGQVTQNFLTCGQQSVCGQDQNQVIVCTFCRLWGEQKSCLDPEDRPLTPVVMFSCDDDDTTISYSLLCDFRADCRDNADESFCVHPSCDVFTFFTCGNGQCVPVDKICNFVSDCQDGSDEEVCIVGYTTDVEQPYLPCPVLVNFDGIRSFTLKEMKHNDSCPDTYYRCSDTFNSCLPVYTRCNGMYDCIDHEDEEDCEEMMCPGFFRCRSSSVCVHGDNLCDGWPHCPQHDDELFCGMICPEVCLCHGHAFLCPQFFSAELFPDLRSLDATGSGMSPFHLRSNVYLVGLSLHQCSLVFVSSMKFPNLRFLDLSDNKLEQVNMSTFVDLHNLQTLIQARNPFRAAYHRPSSTGRRNSLTTLDLSHTSLRVLDTMVLSNFLRLHTLNISFTTLHTITGDGFQVNAFLTEIDMAGSPLKTFPADILKGLSMLRFMSTDNYKICCQEILPVQADNLVCNAPNDEISSCEDLLQSNKYRVFLWLMSCLSVLGNVFSVSARVCVLQSKASKGGFSVFVTNLCMADFLMGVYIAIIGVADQIYKNIYLHYDETWKNSASCKAAGFLSLLSSEVSALVIWLVTLDRFIVFRFPFSRVRFNKLSATVVCLMTWFFGVSLAGLPLLPVTTHWEFYGQTGICIPLPVTRQQYKGHVYSISVMIIFNFILFLLISAGQAFIYWSVQKNTLTSSTTKASQDMTIARRLITVAVTDFMCWFPIGLCGMLALAGVPITSEVNVALAVFVLPLNSVLNPFLYTFNTLAEKRRKLNSAKLLKWLESNTDLLEK